MIFQDPYASLDPRMSVGRIIMEPLTAHHVGKSRAERADMVRALMERVGLRPEFYGRYRDDLRLIPMPGAHSRSLNLANAVSIVLYEALRQTMYAH